MINGTTAWVERVAAKPDGHLALIARIGSVPIRFSTRDLLDAEGGVRLGHDLAVTA
ncbi:hypothetical protein [Methylorubrum aminovorans]|uniref:hypothetical protein n=1 Tax=Methylorubrum aminovorans TaxID=269069 RepID=UPI001EDFE228|nr:hypothetical protein [Methylorubrum aminovorans]GMA74007.1 hypothetical protein GCM10025880_04240 [Methylorubrum aminovorans]